METLGPYLLLEPVGTGSLTEAWRSLRASDGPDGAFCVVKRPLPALATERSYQAAFKQLATAGAGVRHPALVAALDAGETSAIDPLNPGTAWQAQELVVGSNLSGVLNHLLQRSRDIPRAFALHVIQQTLQALAFAHRHGGAGAPQGTTLHGDLSPGNILVSWDGRVLVDDLGLGRARVALTLPANLSQRYRFQYMAPETARDGVLDWRSDLYAAGVLLHEMVAFRRFRRGNTPDELRQQAIAGTWPALETLGIPSDDGLNALLQKALQDHPAARYQTAEQFLADLDAYIQLRNLGATREHIQSLMAGAFPNLARQEEEARGRARTAMSLGQPQSRTLAEAVSQEPHTPLDPTGFAPPAQAAPARGRQATGTRAPPAGGSVARKAALYLGALVVAGVAMLMAISAMQHGNAPPSTVQGPVPRDLTRLVGGRPTLFWTERVQALDRALAVARAAGREQDIQLLEARKADTLRKAAALGMPELATAAANKR